MSNANMPSRTGYGEMQDRLHPGTKYALPEIKISPKGEFLLSRMEHTEEQGNRPEDIDAPTSNRNGDAG